MRLNRGIAALLAAWLAGPVPGLAAVPLGTLHGALTGASGRPLPGVELGLVNLDTGSVTRARTDARGAFAAELAAGLYLVDTTRTGRTLLSGPRVVSLAPGQSLSAVLSLATEDPSPSGGVTLNHDPITCMIAGQSPRIDAVIEPAPAVSWARVYFHSSLELQDYYVEMSRTGGAFVTGLPKPRLDAGPVTYYVATATAEGARTRTEAIDAIVVKEEKDCPDRKVAALFPGGPGPVFSAAGASASPAGFAAGLSSKALLIGAGATAVGVTTAIVVGSGGNTPPASPSR